MVLSPEKAAEPILRVTDLHKAFPVKLGLFKRGQVSAVNGVSFDVYPGETLGIVGESGCGKSTTARLILRLIDRTSGAIILNGTDVQEINRGVMYRGIQMVFQDPYSSVNPRMSIGENIAFPMKVNGFDRDTMQERVSTLLRQVGLHPNHASYFPHQMSGGQLQRVNIARALALEPKVVICDEPVSALDKSIQAQVLNLLKDLQQELNLTYIFISHDLNVVEYMSDRVLVMYLGQVVESCSSDELYKNPLHPYTKVLLSSIPNADPDQRSTGEGASGEIPSPLNPPSGCRFRTRCPSVMDICAQERPSMRQPVAGHEVACFLYESSSNAITAESEAPVHA
ncbi:MAG: ABC transporter ATP-binding protein [Chloroflexota bacterium]